MAHLHVQFFIICPNKKIYIYIYIIYIISASSDREMRSIAINIIEELRQYPQMGIRKFFKAALRRDPQSIFELPIWKKQPVSNYSIIII